MVGRRRVGLTVLVSASVVLATGSPSNGIETTTAATGGAQQALALSGPTPTSPGVTDIASATTATRTAGGGLNPRISGDGRWVVFDSIASLQPGNPSAKADQTNVFVRDVKTGATVQLSRAAAGDGTPQQPTSSSSQPAITDDGRFVTFLTAATNIVPTSGTAPLTLVLCDRDPDSDGTYDETNANGSLTNVCAAVYSHGGDQAQSGAIYRADAPSVAEGFGTSGRVAWTQLTDRPGAPGATAQHVFTQSFSASAGGISLGGSATYPPAQVPMTVTPSASCGTGGSGSSREESEPFLSGFANEVFFKESFGVGGCNGIVSTNALSNLAFSTSTRYDVVPTGCGSGFLGDLAGTALTGPCAPFSGSDISTVEAPNADQYGDHVLFRFRDEPVILEFAGPHALGPSGRTNLMVLATQSGNTIISEVASRDNAGNPVESEAGGISADGRYLAFETGAAGTHDGADPSSGTNHQIVARDLTVDAARKANSQTRLPGALATPRDPTRAVPANCTPSGANQSCASAGATSPGSITMDSTGGRIAYTTSATDLLPTDVTGTDVYVRTWTPTLADQLTPGGTAQTGATKTFNVPVSISGFGPLEITGTTVSGADAGQFAKAGDNCTGRVIHVNEPCTVALRFEPTSVGVKNASIRVGRQFAAGTAEAARVTATAVADGPKNAPATTVRTSLDPSGGEAADGGFDSKVSGNGRWDVFVSDSDLLGRKPVSPGPSTEDVYVRDLSDPQNTVQISLHSRFGAAPQSPSKPAATAGHPAGVNPNGNSYWPSISSDGRFVSFVTDSSDVAPLRKGGNNEAADSTFSTLVVCDRDPDADGKFDELQPGTKLPDYVCFSVESGSYQDGGLNLDLGNRPALSGSGSRVTWVESDDQARDSERVRYADLPRTTKGALKAPANFSYLGSNVPGFTHGTVRNDESNVGQSRPVLNEDGTKLAYFAEQFPSEGTGNFVVIEADLAAGTDRRVDGLGTNNSASGVEIENPPALSDDGTRIAYDYYDGDSGKFRVYVSTLTGTPTGSDVTTRLESLDNNGDAASGTQPALSGDGRYLAFVTQAGDMSNGVDPPDGQCVDGPTETEFNVVCQVVARDLVRDAQRRSALLPRVPSELVSTALPGTACPNAPAAGRLCGGNSDSSYPSIDDTGSEIGFDSGANDLVADDTNDFDGEGHSFTTDAFVHTWRPALTSQPVDFGSVKLGSTKTKAVRTGVEAFGSTPEAFGPVSLGKASVTGAAGGDFQILSTTCSGQTLHEGAPDGQPIEGAPESCTTKIRFKPTVPGVRNAALQLAVGKNGYPRVLRNPKPPKAIVQQFDPASVRQLTGFGATPVVTVNPTTVNFGTRLPDAPLTKTLVVSNTGSSDLVISAVVVNDTTHPGAKGDYAVDFSSCLPKVAAGGSCVITVTFTGSRVGVRDAALLITSNAIAGPTSVGVLARVNKPKVESNPAVSPARRVITVTGSGFAPNHPVDVGFDKNPQATVTTKTDGTFVLQMVVLGNGPQGPRLLFAHSVGLHPSITDDFPFLVVLGSTDPGTVVKRD